MRIGIDLDGVCYDFAASLRASLIAEGTPPARLMTPPTRWEFYEDWGLSLQQFLDACHRGVNAGIIFTHGNPFPGTREALESIRAAGHTLHIVTDRNFGSPGASEFNTRDWLHRHSLPFDSLTFAADKTVVRVDMMVDDKPANYEALCKAGVEAWLYTRPWNLDVDAWRVHSLAKFASLVMERRRG